MKNAKIPVSKEERKSSLVNMIEAYEKAFKVLVLDPELEMTEFDPKRAEEALMQVVSSRWRTRLWTMQEGAATKSLYFRCRNSALNLKSIEASMQDYNGNGKAYDGGTYRKILLIGGIAVKVAAHSYQPINKFWHCRHKQWQSALWAGMQNWTTTHVEGEPICFASPLGLPASAKRQLLAIDSKRHCEALLSEHDLRNSSWSVKASCSRTGRRLTRMDL